MSARVWGIARPVALQLCRHFGATALAGLETVGSRQVRNGVCSKTDAGHLPRHG